MARTQLITSESVSEGHPDKMADQISDSILDAILEQDPNGRVACETMIKTGVVIVAGEISTSATIDTEQLVRERVNAIGYDNTKYGFDGHTCGVLNALGKQSPDIAQGVDETGDREQGAGDQGMMYGYATNETEVLMPTPITFAHRLVKRQSEVLPSGTLPCLRPDAKSQVTVRYENGVPKRVDAVVLSTPHDPDVDQKVLHEAVMEEIIRPIIPAQWFAKDTRFYINPTGRFVIGGPVGDCGLTGRKIIVDTYGGVARHGGGAFSGKDPSKVDRSAASMARYIAKNIVAAELAEVCEVQLSYAIGRAAPTTVTVDCNGTARIDEVKIAELVRQHFDLTPGGIIATLDLKRPIYHPTAVHGHFGRTPGDGGTGTFTWEQTDKAAALKAAAEQSCGATA